MNSYITAPFIMNINGSCGGGKSYFIKYYIQTSNNLFDYILVISNTSNFTDDYTFLETSNINHSIHGTLDCDKIINKLMDIQKNQRLKNIKKNALIIFDDVMSSVKDSKAFKNLVTTYRHYNISVIFSVQYASASANYLREISPYIIIFKQETKAALQLIYENYFASQYSNYTEFVKAFSVALPKYHFYFIDRKKNIKVIMKCP